MTKYEKAVAYINEVGQPHTEAELAGMNDNIVYILTDIGPLRLHNEEIEALASNYDIHQAHK